MAIKCTYLELASTGPGLVKLRAVSAKSVVAAARIARFVKVMIKELAEYEKIRNELLVKYGKPLEGSTKNEFRIPPEQVAEFGAEMLKLQAIEVEIPVTPLPMACYSLAELTVDEMNGLGVFIEWPPEDEEAPAEAAPAAPPKPLKSV